MKRKYYMRGLGFGILITTLVFCFLNSGSPTDEEVIKRAIELGYTLQDPGTTPGIDLDELKEKTPAPTQTPAPTNSPTPEPTPTPTDKPVPTPTEIPVPTQTVAPTQTPVPQETEAPTQTPTPEPTATVAPTATPEPTVAAARVQIVIVKGNTASKVCKMIEEAGIISDWEEFRDYLKSRNLVNEINVGKFTLSGDMTFEEIAKIITGK